MVEFNYDHAAREKNKKVVVNNSNLEFIEAVCIEVPRILDQVKLRKRVTRNIALLPGSKICHPSFSYIGADNFCIIEVKVISKTDLDFNSCLKKVDLFVKIGYEIHYSDGINKHKQPDTAVFELALYNIYYPDTNTKHFPQNCCDISAAVYDENGLAVEVEAIGEAFGDVISPCTGALILDVGIFFIIKIIHKAELLVPAYSSYRNR